MADELQKRAARLFQRATANLGLHLTPNMKAFFEDIYEVSRSVINANADPDTARSLQAEVERLREEVSALQASASLRFDADMRAIDRWHAAGGDEMTWPDHADLCTWLMERLTKSHALIRQMGQLPADGDVPIDPVEAENARLRARVGELEGAADFLVKCLHENPLMVHDAIVAVEQLINQKASTP